MKRINITFVFLLSVSVLLICSDAENSHHQRGFGLSKERRGPMKTGKERAKGNTKSDENESYDPEENGIDLKDINSKKICDTDEKLCCKKVDGKNSCCRGKKKNKKCCVQERGSEICCSGSDCKFGEESFAPEGNGINTNNIEEGEKTCNANSFCCKFDKKGEVACCIGKKETKKCCKQVDGKEHCCEGSDCNFNKIDIVSSGNVDDEGSSDENENSGGGANSNVKQLKKWFNKKTFDSFFTNSRANWNCNGEKVFTYENLIGALSRYPDFLNSDKVKKNKIELAAFLAQTSQETTGGWTNNVLGWGYCFKEEVGARGLATHTYCNCSDKPGNCECNPSKQYFGRGPMQLSWNYNYGLFSESLYGTRKKLLNNPDILLEDGEIAFAAGIWFWMTPQYSKPSCHDVIIGISKEDSKRPQGFGTTTSIINGGVECGQGWDVRPNRQIYYNHYLETFGVSDNREKSCKNIQGYY